ncbi:DUF6458 family protein [Ornithinimicrobium sp. INDO-MA30-4]|uniref:DUF6458 family protein n=1 Tax=Ornithinimicrobium sp. INDO-MA30-4 TaxID=2908651 RepID=UPI001F44E764|nr:DUF6458 family protein [Ornithinimicrobium sp. INDO-MA30-4]UJH69792.1 DUF6458 family protein [Ornithinimicrobium sp. INDO-MA30-4]
MGIGFGIFLFVVGAILGLALEVNVAWIDLTVVGNILMIAGAMYLVASLIMNAQNRKTTVRQVYDDGQPKYDPRYDEMPRNPRI